MSSVTGKTTCCILCFIVFACTRKEIEFGSVPENTYTRLSYIDTTTVQLSTVLIDSFATGGTASFLAGKYRDPYLGLVAATPFFQFSNPGVLPDIPESAVFDSLSFIAKLNGYYYGDTTADQTFYINELAESITLDYDSKLYNTTRTPVKPVPLGNRSVRIRPLTDDSVTVRLDDNKGIELFGKLRSKEEDITNTENFLNYFKGVSVTTGADDTLLVCGLQDSMIIRVHYHTTVPYPEAKYIDFISRSNSLAYNQLLTDRTGTGIIPVTRGVSEIPSSATTHLSFSQPGTGLYLKMTFPSLKAVLQNEDIVRLLKAELVIRPVARSFDKYKFRLPTKLALYQTDGSNNVGQQVIAQDGSTVLTVDPVIDNVYGEDNYYSFDVTSYVNAMLNTAGSEDIGFYAVKGLAGSLLELDRIIAGDALLNNYKTQLKLSVLVIKK